MNLSKWIEDEMARDLRDREEARRDKISVAIDVAISVAAALAMLAIAVGFFVAIWFVGVRVVQWIML
jgi:hypothetical protein